MRLGRPSTCPLPTEKENKASIFAIKYKLMIIAVGDINSLGEGGKICLNIFSLALI